MEAALTPLVRCHCATAIISFPLPTEDYKQLDEILCQSAIECIVREKSVWRVLFSFLLTTAHCVKVWI